MQQNNIGDIVIANDFLGIVIEVNKGMILAKNKDGKKVKLKAEAVSLVSSRHSLLHLINEKAVAHLKGSKNGK